MLPLVVLILFVLDLIGSRAEENGDPDSGLDVGGQRGLDEVGQLEQQCVLAQQVLGQQRLVVCHPVAQLVQLAGADVDVGPGGCRRGTVVQIRAPLSPS